MKVSDVAALNTRALRGPRGLKGPKGEPGEGLLGPKGPKGDKGDQGETASDELVKVSPEDESAGFLSDKLQAGHGVNLSRRAGPDGEALFIDVQTGGPVGVRASGGGGGGGTHPNLAAHDTLGLATDAELTAHAATSHGGTHPDLATHDALGLATDAEMSAAIAAAIAAHAATPHGSDIPPEIGFSA